LIMKSNAKPDVRAEIFLDYAQTVFLPNLAEVRRLDDGRSELLHHPQLRFFTSSTWVCLAFANGIRETNCLSERRKRPLTQKEGISWLQTNNGGTYDMQSFSGTRIWVWYNKSAISTLIQRGKGEGKRRLSRAAVYWLPPESVVDSTACW
jgi:hypothetical protein